MIESKFQKILLKDNEFFLQSKFCVPLIFSIPFVIQMTNIWISSTFPDYPSVKTYKKNLKEIEFPISFKLCARELETTKRYSRYGYFDEYHFFEGRSLFNHSLRGWNGFSETNLTIGSTQGIIFDGSNKHYCLGALMKESAVNLSVFGLDMSPRRGDVVCACVHPYVRPSLSSNNEF